MLDYSFFLMGNVRDATFCLNSYSKYCVVLFIPNSFGSFMVFFTIFIYFFCIYRAQTLMKSRLVGAQKGHSLLKKKADALQMRFRLILSKIIDVSLIVSHWV